MYHALTPDRKHLALKIYKTSILVFKDRDKYVSGEYRFRKGYRCVTLLPVLLGEMLITPTVVTTLARWFAYGLRRRCGT